jgi:hypothetical protein
MGGINLNSNVVQPQQTQIQNDPNKNKKNEETSNAAPSAVGPNQGTDKKNENQGVNKDKDLDKPKNALDAATTKQGGGNNNGSETLNAINSTLPQLGATLGNVVKSLFEGVSNVKNEESNKAQDKGENKAQFEAPKNDNNLVKDQFKIDKPIVETKSSGSIEKQTEKQHELQQPTNKNSDIAQALANQSVQTAPKPPNLQ